MDKISAYTSTANASDEFTEGDPSTGTPATEVDGGWLNAIQRELVKVIESMDLTLDNTDDTLLWQAFEAVYGKTFAGDPNGNVAAEVLRERCWDTSTSPPTLYFATAADGSTGGTTWVQAFPKPTVRAVGVLARHQNLVIKNNASNPATQIDIDADELEVYDANGIPRVFTGVDLTVDITASGVNGLDTGSEASDTWYYLWVIYNPTTDTVAGLLSTASDFASLTLPSGYTFAGLVGADYNNGSSDFLGVYQRGGEAFLTSRVRDVNTNNVGTIANLGTLSVPPNTWARFSVQMTGGDGLLLITSTFQDDEVPSSDNKTIQTVLQSTTDNVEITRLVDDISQIRYRGSESSSNISIITQGWRF